MPAQRSSSNFLVQVDGTELAPAVQLALVDAIIEDELNLPDSCELVFRDQLRTAVEHGRFALGKRLQVKVASEATPAGLVIFDGEITGLEAEIERDSTLTIVRGLDRLHRLQRGTHTETYLDMTYGDIATRIAQRHGMSMGSTGSNSVVHEAVVQWNQTDWEFVSELAARIGHEVVIADGALELREPPTAEGAPADGEVGSENSGRQLVVGENVLQLRAAVSGGEQVKEVIVRGWDPTAKEKVEGVAAAQSSSGSAHAGIGAAEAAEALDGGTLVLAERAIQSAEVASDEANSVAQQLGSSVVELDGVVFGNPDLRAGVNISVTGLGSPFDGKYVLTSCRHTYDADQGYRTCIRVSGRQNRTLLGVIGGARRLRSAGGGPTSGVVPAIVSDIDDPDARGRVKVTFPWLADEATSHWARIAHVGAGNERGFVVMPEVDDEVLVAFEHGDARYPVVIGGLFNGKDALPVQPVDGGEVVSRALVTRIGHRIELHDTDKTITLATPDDEHRIVLDAQNGKILIESSGEVEISSDKQVTFTTPHGMSFQSDGALELKGMGVTIDAGGGDFKAKGTNCTVEGSAQAELKGGATAKVSGAMVQIN